MHLRRLNDSRRLSSLCVSCASGLQIYAITIIECVLPVNKQCWKQEPFLFQKIEPLCHSSHQLTFFFVVSCVYYLQPVFASLQPFLQPSLSYLPRAYDREHGKNSECQLQRRCEIGVLVHSCRVQTFLFLSNFRRGSSTVKNVLVFTMRLSPLRLLLLVFSSALFWSFSFLAASFLLSHSFRASSCLPFQCRTVPVKIS